MSAGVGAATAAGLALWVPLSPKQASPGHKGQPLAHHTKQVWGACRTFQGRLALDNRKMSSQKGWIIRHKMPRAGVESSSLEGFRSHMNVALGDTASGGLGSARGMVGLHGLRGLFQPKQCCDLLAVIE